MCGEVHLGPDPSQRVDGTVNLGATDVGAAVQQLPVQVRFGHRVGIDDGQVAASRRREVAQHRASQSSGADHRHARGLEPPLTGNTQLGYDELAGISVEVGRGQVFAVFHPGQ